VFSLHLKADLTESYCAAWKQQQHHKTSDKKKPAINDFFFFSLQTSDTEKHPSKLSLRVPA